MSKSRTTVQKSAKSVNEAVEAALAELGIAESEAEIEIVEEGSKGFLGLGAKDAVVKVTANLSDADAAKKFLSDIFGAMKLDVSIEAEEKDDMLDIDLSGDSMGIIIGKRGDTLDSLQYLTSIVVNRKVSLDTENFRKRRTETLEALAQRLAERVAKTHKKYTLEPMNAYERRIIHSALQGNEKVTTFSVGEDPYRKVVIAPKDRPHRDGSRNSDGHFRDRKPAERPEAPREPKRITAVPKRIEIPRPTKYNKQKAGSFEEYLAEQEAAANKPEAVSFDEE